ncbi:MAG TPA: DUF2721 domain-containing protein [Lacunisphaera sp.]|nr:DUF2721 domain-containing protein [Lacunisphaera sp.]
MILSPGRLAPGETMASTVTPAPFTMNITLNQLIPVLQLATGPVILISGVGLLLLSLTNRLGRLIDRSRLLHRERLAVSDAARRAVAEEQLAIIDRRAGMLRRAIKLAGLTVLLVSVLILTLFLSALLKLELGPLIIGLFSLAILALIASTIEFLREVTASLDAVRLETRAEVEARK